MTPDAAAFEFAGTELLAMSGGALWWPDERALVVADLHLEKATSLARHGAFLPPYDSGATLARLAALIAGLQPRRVLCLGDSFHDAEGAGRLAADHVRAVADLARGRDWWWIMGNHDPAPPSNLAGQPAIEAALGSLVFRHEAATYESGPCDGTASGRAGEISGHFHPKASIVAFGRRLSCRCFAQRAGRLILPAFGTYTGGLDVFAPALAALLAPSFTVHLLGERRVHTLPSSRLASGPA